MTFIMLRHNHGKMFLMKTEQDKTSKDSVSGLGEDYSIGMKTSRATLGKPLEMICGSASSMKECAFKTPAGKSMRTSGLQKKYGRITIMIESGNTCKMRIKKVQDSDWGPWKCFFVKNNGQKIKFNLNVFPSVGGAITSGGSTLSPGASTLSPLASTTNPNQAGAPAGASCIPGVILCSGSMKCVKRTCQIVQKPGGSCGFGKSCGPGLGCVNSVCTAGVPDRIVVHYTGSRYGTDFKGTYIKAGWEVFGYPVFRKTGDKERVFYRNLEGFWCFRYGSQGVVNEHFCHSRVPVKNGKFPFIPPEAGWKRYYSGTTFYDEQNMRVVSHW